MSLTRFKSYPIKLDYVPQPSETDLKAEPSLESVGLAMAGTRGGPLTKFILATIMSSQEWQDVESNDMVTSELLYPTVTVRTHLVQGLSYSWWTPWRVLPTPSKSQSPEYRFTCLLSNQRSGVQHVVFVDDDYTCDLDLSQPSATVAKQLDDSIIDQSINRPPKLKIQTDGDVMYFDHHTIHKIMPAHSDGWLLWFELKYTSTEPTTAP